MLFMALALQAIEPPARPAEVEVVRDPITDEIRAYATVRDGGERLVVSCAPADYDGARVTFHSRRWLARGNLFTGERRVTYRFDELPPVRSMWDVEHRRGRIGDDDKVDAFLRDLVTSERLVIRVRDVEYHVYDMTFRLVDVRPAVEQALAACAAADAAA
jgi:hypothetical protein